MSFIVEMKRRKVLRAAFVYMVMFWLLLQITDVVGSILDLPAWVAKLIFFLLLGGLPIALILAWEFDLTSLGIYREKPQLKPRGNIAPGESGNKRVNDTIGSIAAVWIVFIGTGLSVGAAAVIHLHEVRVVDRQFDMVAQEIAHELGHHLKSDSEVLRTLGALFVDNRQPDLDTFQHMSEAVIAEHDEIRAIEWVPRVADADREPFVTEMKDVYPGFDIKAFDASGEEISAERRDLYFPVTYTVPRTGNENAIGFDLLSNPDRAAALTDAILTGKTRQTKPIELVQTKATGFLMFSPVFQDDEVPVSRTARFANLRGFTLAVIDVQKLLTNAISTSPAATNFLGEIAVFDAQTNNAVPVVRIDNSKGSDLSASTRAVAQIDAGFGLQCLVELRPTRALVVSMFSSEHYIVGGVGILIAIICAMIINAVLTAREMPARLQKAGNREEDQNWIPSKWQNR
jgi:CHASE1-domain containing sensor protein